MQRRDRFGGHTDDRVRDRLRAETRGVYDHIGGDAHRRRAAGVDHEPLLTDLSGEDRCFECDHRAVGLGVATQR